MAEDEKESKDKTTNEDTTTRSGRTAKPPVRFQLQTSHQPGGSCGGHRNRTEIRGAYRKATRQQ